MSLKEITQKYSPLRNPVLVHLPCACKAGTPFLTAASIFGMQSERVLIGYKRFCSRCCRRPDSPGPSIEAQIEPDTRKVLFTWHRSLLSNQMQEIRELVIAAYQNPPVYGSWSTIAVVTENQRTKMTRELLADKRYVAQQNLENARRDVRRNRNDTDVYRVLAEHAEALPIQSAGEVVAALQELKDHKTILDFGMAGTTIAIRWPKYQVILPGCRRHQPGRYELPPYQITGSLNHEPKTGVTSITKLNGEEYPHPHARILCFNEEMGETGVHIPNEMGLDNHRTLELLWSRDIRKSLDLIHDYMLSAVEGYRPICCKGAKLLEAMEYPSPGDTVHGIGAAELELERKMNRLDEEEQEVPGTLGTGTNPVDIDAPVVPDRNEDNVDCGLVGPEGVTLHE